MLFCNRAPKMGAMMEANRNTSGFDYLRLVLAVSVLLVHSFSTSYGKPGAAFLFSPPWRGIITMILPMFFALSGFLVTGSLFRTKTLREFIALRLLRLVPALAVEVTLSAIVLGAIFTTLPIAQYFSDAEFWKYFMNIVGRIHFWLPGVFKDNPITIVNISLWTIPYELECYMALIALSLLGLVYRRFWLLIVIIIVNIGLFTADKYYGVSYSVDDSLPPRLLVMSYLYGVTLYIYRDKIPLNNCLTLLAFAISYLMLNSIDMSYFAPLAVTYTTVGIGLMNPPRRKLLLSGDYSYGIYLYAFPIQQAYAHLLSGTLSWYGNIVFSLSLTAMFAAFSWHAVEKHVLKLKRHFKSNPVLNTMIFKGVAT